MRPVNKLDFKIHPKRTIGRHIDLLIDGQSLLDVLENSINKRINWKEKSGAKLDISELENSLQNAGKYAILTSAHCDLSEDILLKEFKVIHKNDIIHWEVKPPGADFYYDDYEILKFSFHKSQYEKIVHKILTFK